MTIDDWVVVKRIRPRWKPMGGVFLCEDREDRLYGSRSIDFLFPDWTGESETLGVPSPHDDDGAIGGGQVIQFTIKNGGRVVIFPVTDGSQGYWDLELQPDIVSQRKDATLRAYRKFGMNEADLEFLDYPDGDLALHTTVKPPNVEYEHGLVKRFTQLFRQYGITRLLAPNRYDDHSDHIRTREAAGTACNHANGKIWRECGEQLTNIKTVLEYAVWGPFQEVPDICLYAPDDARQIRLDAVEVYCKGEGQASLQAQIPMVVQSVIDSDNREGFKIIYPPPMTLADQLKTFDVAKKYFDKLS